MSEPFKIFRVGTEDAERIEQSVNDPHQHDVEELIIGIEGQLEHFIDFKTSVFQAPFVSFVTRGKVHKVRPLPLEGKCSMWVIRFKSEFIAETTFQLYSCFHDRANLLLDRGHCFKRLEVLCELMEGEYIHGAQDYAVIRPLLSALFAMIESEQRKTGNGEEQVLKPQSETFRNFLRILEENFRRPVGVEYYAEKLFMSSRNLNLICRQVLQQSVGEIIETRKLIEAKNLLITTDKTISEIGFELGYNEKGYFTHVFKKKSGLTPGEFREEMRKVIHAS